MEKIKKITEKVKCTFRNICDTIKKIWSEYEFYKGLWDKPQGKAAVKLVWEQLLYLLKKIKPGKIEGDVVVGTGDPASTGQMIGAVAAIYGILPEKLHITPDFEEKRLEGTLQAAGKFRVIHLVVVVIKLIADKNVRYIYRKVQAKEGKENEQ
jgi:uncharacterized DUF497 family protein